MKLADKRLDEILRGGRVPDRSAGYWEHFPKRVTARLREGASPIPVAFPSYRWFWAAGLAMTCLLLALGIGLATRSHRVAETDYANAF